ncbi:hypothetical protein A2U01_0113814, partial [Trifolium medium]|nr:hypothetical protein [Trifolium medium]
MIPPDDTLSSDEIDTHDVDDDIEHCEEIHDHPAHNEEDM